MSESTTGEDIERKRLYWHARRGMWELDLLLIPFLEHRYDGLSASDQQVFRDLIKEEDQNLFAWLMRRQWPEDDARRRVVKMIVEYAETTDNDQYRTL
ncbi:FAD assembly factor SdhE [Aidingimonas lacisalsi]|uniref:FAD assembly factor SdhE n=1 Tax=Aidingimonas lacisalsi TaxID=2604086 RepID=UPI0011D2778E|nr:succinate dehydrogenase assembly factor 2 [Aidingimonas lacisalsi]